MTDSIQRIANSLACSLYAVQPVVIFIYLWYVGNPKYAGPLSLLGLPPLYRFNYVVAWLLCHVSSGDQ